KYGPTPTVLFDSYEQDFLHIIDGVRQKLEGEGRNGVGEQRKAALRKVEIELDEADDISIQSAYTTRLKSARADLNKYKRLSDDPYGERSDRNDFLLELRRWDDGSRRIQDSTSLALQTETEQIENSRNTVRSSGTLTKMIRQMYKQRVILGGIIAFFVVLILVILYFKLFRR
ncbi:vesicle transport v-snare protein vti1, partial [Ephemerocybe angulata]